MASSSIPTSDHLIFIGTYTRTTSRGIYAVRLNAQTGVLSAAELAAEASNPTFLALQPNRRHLYATGDGRKVNGGASPAVVVGFSIDGSSGRLAPLNEQELGATGGSTHLAADKTGRMLVAVHYGLGRTAAFPLQPDGSIGARTTLIEHSGPLGPQKERQDKPHAHSVTISPDNRFAYVCDLGLDRVHIFRLDLERATIVPHEPAFVAAPAGAGPRHSAFSADGKFFYVMNELAGSVSVFACDSASGTLSLRQTISSLPAGFTGQNTSAEIRVHPNGRFVYASNRGPDNLAVFARNAADGTLRLVEIVDAGGKHPRNFALSPDGAWLVCAHMDSNTLCSFRVDAQSGRLTRIAGTVEVATPVCVCFVN